MAARADEITKRELAEYFETWAEWILPHTQGRPLTLFRCPQRMKHSKGWAPQRRRRRGSTSSRTSVQALVSLVQMDVLEVHTWNSRE